MKNIKTFKQFLNENVNESKLTTDFLKTVKKNWLKITSLVEDRTQYFPIHKPTKVNLENGDLVIDLTADDGESVPGAPGIGKSSVIVVAKLYVVPDSEAFLQFGEESEVIPGIQTQQGIMDIVIIFI